MIMEEVKFESVWKIRTLCSEKYSDKHKFNRTFVERSLGYKEDRLYGPVGTRNNVLFQNKTKHQMVYTFFETRIVNWFLELMGQTGECFEL
jgi:hypothetical protein